MVKELKLKYTKYQKNKINFITYNFKKMNFYFGNWGILTQEPGRLSKKQIEAFRKQLRRSLKKQVRLWIKIKPNIIITKKATGLRMGKGKGYNYYKICKVFAGQLIFEFTTKFFKLKLLIKKIKAAISKLPLKCKIINNTY